MYIDLIEQVKESSLSNMSFYSTSHFPQQFGGFTNLCAADFRKPGTTFKEAFMAHHQEIKTQIFKRQLTVYKPPTPTKTVEKKNAWSPKTKLCFLAAGAVLVGIFFAQK